MARIVIAGRSAQSREQMASLLSSSGYPVYRLCGHAGELRRVLLAATGALMSPVSAMQGESIPAICHAVTIEGEGTA